MSGKEPCTSTTVEDQAGATCSRDGARTTPARCAATPLPQVGVHVVAEDGRIYRFVEVDPMIDPADGFLGRLEAVDTLVAKNAPCRPMSRPKPPSNFSDQPP